MHLLVLESSFPLLSLHVGCASKHSQLFYSGLMHELTIPKTPERNGVAERLNHTLVEMTRAKVASEFLGRGGVDDRIFEEQEPNVRS